MRSVPLPFFFSLALISALFGSIFFPFFPLNSFVPFLAIVYYVTPLSKALWISCCCGLILDLLSSEFHFGVHALTLTVTSALLFHQKRHFFEDKPMSLSLFSTVISASGTILQIIFVHLFDRGISFSLTTILTDLIALPLADGLYGFLWFTCPMQLYIYMKKKGWNALLQKTVNNE